MDGKPSYLKAITENDRLRAELKMVNYCNVEQIVFYSVWSLYLLSIYLFLLGISFHPDIVIYVWYAGMRIRNKTGKKSQEFSLFQIFSCLHIIHVNNALHKPYAINVASSIVVV